MKLIIHNHTDKNWFLSQAWDTKVVVINHPAELAKLPENSLVVCQQACADLSLWLPVLQGSSIQVLWLLPSAAQVVGVAIQQQQNLLQAEQVWLQQFGIQQQQIRVLRKQLQCLDIAQINAAPLVFQEFLQLWAGAPVLTQTPPTQPTMGLEALVAAYQVSQSSTLNSNELLRAAMCQPLTELNSILDSDQLFVIYQQLSTKFKNQQKKLKELELLKQQQEQALELGNQKQQQAIAHNDELTAEKVLLQQKLESLHQEIKQLHQEHTETTAAYEEQRQNVAAELAASKQRNQQLAAINTEQSSQLLQLQKQATELADASQQQTERYTAELSSAQQHNEQLSNELTLLQHQFQQLTKDKLEQSADAQKIQQQLIESLKTSDYALQQLNKDLSVALEQNQLLVGTNTDLTNQNTQQAELIQQAKLQIQQLREELTEAIGQNERLAINNKDLNFQVAQQVELSQQIELRNTSMLQAAEQQVLNLTQELEFSEQQREQQSVQQAALTKALHQQQHDLLQLNQKLELERNALSQLRHQQQLLLSTNQAGERENTALQLQLKQHADELQKLLIAAQDQKLSADEQQALLQHELTTLVALHEQEKAGSLAEHSALRQENTLLLGQLHQVQEQLEAYYLSAEQVKIELEQQLQQLSSTKNAELSQAAEQYKAVKTALDSSKMQLDKTTKLLADRQQELENLQQLLLASQEQVTNKTAELSNSEEKLASVTVTARKLEQQQQALQQQVIDAEAEGKLVLEQLLMVQEELEKLFLANQKNEAEFATTLAQKDKKIVWLQKSGAKQKAEVEQLQEQVQALQNVATELTQRVEQLNETAVLAEQRNAELEQSNNDLSQELLQKEQRFNQLTIQSEQRLADLEQSKAQLGQQLVHKEQQSIEQAKHAEQLKLQLVNAKNDNIDLQRQKTADLHQLAQLHDAARKELQNQLQQREAELEQLQKQLQQTQQRSGKELSQLQNSYQQTTDELSQLKQNYQKLNAELKTLKRSSKAQNLAQQKEVSTLMAQIIELKKARQELDFIKTTTSWKLTKPVRFLSQSRRTKAEKAKLERDCALLEQHDLFDAQWYYQQYPDVAASGMSAAEHYICFGAQEGRNPGPVFDTQWYYRNYLDVALNGANPLVHYIKFGHNEGRHISGNLLSDKSNAGDGL